MNSRIPPPSPLPSGASTSTPMTTSQSTTPTSSLRAPIKEPINKLSSGYHSSSSPTNLPSPLQKSPECGENPLYDPSTAPYVPSSHVTSKSPHPATLCPTLASPASPAPVVTSPPAELISRPSGPSTARGGKQTERAEQGRQVASGTTLGSEPKSAPDKFGCRRDTTATPSSAITKTHAGSSGHTAENHQPSQSIDQQNPDSTPSSQSQHKPPSLHKHLRQRQGTEAADSKNSPSNDSRSSKRTSLTSCDSESSPSDVKAADTQRAGRDKPRSQLVQQERPKQSYGSLEGTSGTDHRSIRGSLKSGSRRGSGYRYDACRDSLGGYSTGSGASCTDGLEDDYKCGDDDDDEDDDDDDCSVFSSTDGARWTGGKQRASLTSGRDTEVPHPLSRSPDNNNDNDDDLENEINENVGLVSGKQGRDKPSSSTSVSFKEGKTKTERQGKSSVDEAEKPPSTRKNFARLIGLYRRDLSKSGKVSRGPALKTNPSAQSCTTRQSTTQLNSPTSPRTPTIQITTPTVTDAPTVTASVSSGPVLKSALVKSSPSSSSGTTTTTATTPTKYPLPNTAKHKVSFITGLRRFSREKAAFLRVDHSEHKQKPVPTSAPTFLFPALPLDKSGDSSTGRASGSGGSRQAGPGGIRRSGAGGDRRKLKVEFAVMESEVVVENSRGIRGRGRWGVMGAGGARGGELEDGADRGMFSLKDDVENDVAMLGGSRARFRQARLSLLGKPLNYKAHRRDMRYRRLQSRIYNFLERPKSWGSWLYHLTMFTFVIVCLTLGVLSSITELEGLLIQVAVYLEIVMLLWILLELGLRVWSAGCRSRYQGKAGRLRFVRRPLCIIDMILVLASIGTLVVGSTQEQFPQAVLSGLRFFQILRMVRMDRKGGTWKLLGSVVWAHRQELVTTLYIGLLGLVFSSYFVYLAEKDEPRRETDRHGAYNTTTYKPKFNNFADAIWWGVVTLCTVGYGDVVPSTWGGKVIASVSAILGISFFALPAGILGSGFALKVQQQQRQKHLNRRRVPAANLIQCLWRCYAADEHSMSTATWKPHMIPCPSPTSERTPRVNTSFVSRFSTRRRDRSSTMTSRDGNGGGGGGGGGGGCHNSSTHNSNSNHVTNCGVGGGGGVGITAQSPMTARHHSRRSAISASEEEVPNVLDSLVNRTWSHLSLATGLSEQRLHLDSLPFKKENSVSSIGKESEGTEEMDLSPRLTQLTEQHKKAIRAIRKIRYFVSRRKFREARRPYDVKDVIEQYSAGHVDMLGRIKNLQGRLDQILGRQGSKSKDVYESKVCLASRIVKVERQVDDIETKVDLLVDMYKEDRKFLLTHIQHIYSGSNPPSDPPRLPQAPPPSGGSTCSESTNPEKKSLTGFKPRPILIDKQFTSEPATPTGFVTGGGTGGPSSARLGARPGIQRNLSDLSQRIKKRVTYRGLPSNHHDPPSRAQSAACFPVSSLPPPPSTSPTCSATDCISLDSSAVGQSQETVSQLPPSPSTLTHSPDLESSSSAPAQYTSGTSPTLPPKLPPPVPNTVSSTSPNLSERSPHLHSLQSSPSQTSQFQYPSNSAPTAGPNPSGNTEHPTATPSPHQSPHALYSNIDGGPQNLISFSYDNNETPKGQGHFDTVYYAKEALLPPHHNDNRHLPQQQHEQHDFFDHTMELQQQNHHATSSPHQHHHHHHHHPPGSMLSSLMGTSLATVTEQRSTDSDSGQYQSDTCQSSPSRLPPSSTGVTDDEGADADSKGVPSPCRHHTALGLSNSEPLPETTALYSLPLELPEGRTGRPLSPPQCSADSVCSETSSVHEDESVPFLPLTSGDQSRAVRPQSCDTSGRSGLARQSSEALTSPSTTSSQASLLTDSRSHIARGNSQSNASFSPDAIFDERETSFAREGAGSIS